MVKKWQNPPTTPFNFGMIELWRIRNCCKNIPRRIEKRDEKENCWWKNITKTTLLFYYPTRYFSRSFSSVWTVNPHAYNSFFSYFLFRLRLNNIFGERKVVYRRTSKREQKKEQHNKITGILHSRCKVGYFCFHIK